MDDSDDIFWISILMAISLVFTVNISGVFHGCFFGWIPENLVDELVTKIHVLWV